MFKGFNLFGDGGGVSSYLLNSKYKSVVTVELESDEEDCNCSCKKHRNNSVNVVVLHQVHRASCYYPLLHAVLTRTFLK